jgi:signal transduction histidine kinase/ActR/RegA family two-component response regulator
MRSILLLITIFLSCTLSCRAEGASAPRAIEGIIDLTDWRFKEDGPVNLKGDYEFYWREQLDTQDIYRKSQEEIEYQLVPGVWNGVTIDGEKIDGDGYATYRVNILIGTLEPFALKLPDFGTSYRLLVDGVELLKVGEPGIDADSTTPAYYPAIVRFTPTSPRVEVILQISNFDHRLGGPWLPLLFGIPEQIDQLRESQLARDLVLFGAIFIIGLYNLALYALRRENRSTLYLGLFCVFLALRVLLVGDRFMTRVWPNLPFDWYVRLEYLAWFIAVPAFGAFLQNVFPRELHKHPAIAIYACFGLLSLLVLLTPISISSYSVPTAQILTVAALAYGSVGLVLASIRKRNGALILMFAYIFLSFTIVSDMLVNARIISNVLLLDIGLFVFVFSQSILISFRFTQSFKTIEKQREQLSATNIRLQTQQKLRQEAERETDTLRSKITQSEKMEAIGLLAGGVAHDLNNILSSTITYPELALLDIPKSDKLYKPLEMTRQAGLRAAAVIQDLLTLARRGIIAREVVNLNDLIREYLTSIEHESITTGGKDINIKVDLVDDLDNIEASPIHLQKLLMNMISNSMEASVDGGTIHISTHNESVHSKALFYNELKTGDYVVLSIEDSGGGIDPEHLEKIFEPFHTTKTMGQSGSGLGMSVVWGVVQDHKGGIDVMSQLGVGTRFDIYIPHTRKEIGPQFIPIPLNQLLGDGESILVVDDQSDQRQLTYEVLKRLNYEPSVCSSGKEAVDLMADHKFDLILLDMVMDKGWDGPETYIELQKVQPGQRVLLVSGFVDLEKIKEAQEVGSNGFVKKPFTLESIGRAIRNTLRQQD